MYGLFLYTYDYYEWEDFYACSENYDDLVRYKKENVLDELYHDKPIVGHDEHNELKRKEEAHWRIKPIKQIGYK